MKKIVFIHLLNDRSGSPKVLSQTIKALKKGYITEILTSSHKDGFLNDIADINRKLFYRRSENKFITLFYYILSQVLLFFQCLKYWNEDVVFYINTLMPFGAALAGKVMCKKVIYHVHETSIKPKILKKFLRCIIYLTAHKIIFVSEYLKVEENFKNKEQMVIYNALETNLLQEQNVIKKDFIVLMICSLKKYKGIFEFIQIAKFMNNIKNLKFQLVLNATEDEIYEYLKANEKPNNLVIFDKKNDLSKFYKEASLLLNLSRPDSWIETFGLTILEGMEYGLPSIVPQIGGPVEIVRDGNEGFQLSCYEIEKIAVKIQFLMENEAEYLRLSNNSKDRVKDFDIKVFEEKIFKILENI